MNTDVTMHIHTNIVDAFCHLGLYMHEKEEKTNQLPDLVSCKQPEAHVWLMQLQTLTLPSKVLCHRLLTKNVFTQFGGLTT